MLKWGIEQSTFTSVHLVGGKSKEQALAAARRPTVEGLPSHDRWDCWASRGYP